jgi:hypothetical protein
LKTLKFYSFVAKLFTHIAAIHTIRLRTNLKNDNDFSGINIDKWARGYPSFPSVVQKVMKENYTTIQNAGE